MTKTVFILGAGATRGCSFVNDMKREGHCLPPLDTDFFTQLQRVSSAVHSHRINRLIVGLVEWFGPNYVLGMEQVFSHLEHAERMLRHPSMRKHSFVLGSDKTRSILLLSSILIR